MKLHANGLFNRYNKFGSIETSYIALAKPGKRLLGILNGVDEASCSLEINLNNTWILSFTINRIIDGRVSNFYDQLQQHMELQLPDFGWFKINEEPQISGDGNTETCSVRAESLEIELQQYSIKGAEINTGTTSSWEQLAVDNVYVTDDGSYQMAWDNLKFYRDCTEIKAALEYFKITSMRKQDLIFMLNSGDYPVLRESWHMLYETETDKFNKAIEAVMQQYPEGSSDYRILESYLNDVKSQQTAYQLIRLYPEIAQQPGIIIKDVDLRTYDVDKEEYVDITPLQMMEYEVDRKRQLSLLDMVLDGTDWTVGFVDPTVLDSSDNEDDLIPLAEKVARFQVDASNIYTFLTQDMAQTFRCIFVFDTFEKKVNCFNINNIGVDTNIFLSFNNIQNSITRSASDTIRTVFHVNGGDELDIYEANLGSDKIVDISYYLNTNHFSQEFIDKYSVYEQYREEKRKEYMDLSVRYRNQLEVVADIKDRVPADGADGSQYGSFTAKEIEDEKDKYLAILAGIEKMYVDENGDFDIEKLKTVPDDYNEYLYIHNIILSQPPDALTDLYYDYNAKQYKLPAWESLGQLDIALFNQNLQDGSYVVEEDTSEERQDKTNAKHLKKYLDDYLYDMETYGDSYGLDELKVLRDDMSNRVKSLWSKGYDKPPEEVDAYKTEQYELYVKYSTALADIEEVLAVRQQEYDDAYALLENIAQQMSDLRELSEMSNPIHGFTEDEIALFNDYCIETDYVNENMIITDYFSNQEIVDTENQLIQDAREELYAVSHPQWTWDTTQDNLLLMPEFKNWHDQLDIGNYIRVGFREDDSKFITNVINTASDNQVKLRVISIVLNPFMIDPQIEITFSSMIQYKSRRNDFVELLGLATGAGNNQITATFTNKNLDNTFTIDSGFVVKLLQGGGLSRYINKTVNTAADNAASDAYASVVGNITNIVTPVIHSTKVDVNQLEYSGTGADGYGDFDTIVANMMNAKEAQFGSVVANVITADTGEFGTVFSDLVKANVVEASEVFAGVVTAEEGNFTTLISNSIRAGDGRFGSLVADSLTADSSIFFNNVTVESNVQRQWVVENIAKNITVADLKAGNITVTDQVQILSEDGLLAMNGKRLQFLKRYNPDDEDDLSVYPAVQLGFSSIDEPSLLICSDEVDENDNPEIVIGIGYIDNSGKPKMVIRDEDGAMLFSSTGTEQIPKGLQAEAISNQLIVNDMLRDGDISKSKLAFTVIEPNEYGGVDITNIYDGQGNQFGVDYTSFKQTTNSALNEINSKKMYRVMIESDNGNIFKNGNISCVLSCRVFSWDDEITDTINASQFIWSRKSNDTDGDIQWNANHSGGRKSITITPEDAYGRSVFSCTVTLPDGSVASSD